MNTSPFLEDLIQSNKITNTLIIQPKPIIALRLSLININNIVNLTINIKPN